MLKHGEFRLKHGEFRLKYGEFRLISPVCNILVYPCCVKRWSEQWLSSVSPRSVDLCIYDNICEK